MIVLDFTLLSECIIITVMVRIRSRFLRTCSFLTLQKSLSSFRRLLPMFHPSTIRQPSLTKTDSQQRRQPCKTICMFTEGIAGVKSRLRWNISTRFFLGIDRLVPSRLLWHKNLSIVQQLVEQISQQESSEWAVISVILFRRWCFSAF